MSTAVVVHQAGVPTRSLTNAQAAVLSHLLQNGPQTDEVLVETYEPRGSRPRQAPSGLRTRRNELVELGFVGWTGNTKVTKYNRRAAEWRAL